MSTFLLVIFFLVCLAVILLQLRFRNTKIVFIVRFLWIVFSTFIYFFFFSGHFTRLQNGVAGFVAIVALIYFGYQTVKSIDDD